MIPAKPEMLIIPLLRRRVCGQGRTVAKPRPLENFIKIFPHFPNLPIYS